MISDNKPILVTDINSEPRTHAGFATLWGPGLRRRTDHVQTGDRLSVASLGDSERALDSIDRDRLAMFAESLGTQSTALSFGSAYTGRRPGAFPAALDRVTLDALDDAEDELVARTEARPALRRAAPEFAAVHLGSVIDETLTTRERQVLALMAEGATALRIAETLGKSSGTAKSHVAHILRKLDAKNRADAVARYLRNSEAGDLAIVARKWTFVSSFQAAGLSRAQVRCSCRCAGRRCAGPGPEFGWCLALVGRRGRVAAGGCAAWCRSRRSSIVVCVRDVAVGVLDPTEFSPVSRSRRRPPGHLGHGCRGVQQSGRSRRAGSCW